MEATAVVAGMQFPGIFEMSSLPKLTARSRAYRLKASGLAQIIRKAPDHEDLYALMRQALSWIQLAENEEALQAADEASAVVLTLPTEVLPH